MATLEHLAATDKLLKHEPDLDDRDLPERIAFFAPEFDGWLETVLRPLDPLRGRQLSPFEQAEQIMYEFVIGRPMAYSVDYRKLDPLPAHVWELKTTDVRLFGWFAKKAIFVLVCGELKAHLKKRREYTPFVERVVVFRRRLDLDEPKAITGVRHHEVL
jgi:hypothetical protein